MSLIVHAGESMARQWVNALDQVDPDLEVHVHPDLGDPAAVECLLSWKPPLGLIPDLPRLKLLQCSGAGVDQLLGHPDLRRELVVARLLDPRQAGDLAAFAVAIVLSHYRRLDAYEEQQRAARWERLFPHPAIDRLRVGVLGLGTMGQAILSRFVSLGADAAGWSRSGRAVPGARAFAGPEGLDPLLERSDYLICALPLTGETKGILSGRVFDRLPRGAFVINLGRGAHIVEEDLIAALDAGLLSGAALDVFEQEPLPDAHPYWSHALVRVTPHIGAFADPSGSAAQIVENLRRVRRGEEVLGRVDLERGY